MSTCYRKISGLIQPEEDWTLCRDYQGLCCQGSDLCLAEQICHNPSVSSTNGSGYYIGLCTDATYQSSSCSSRCTDDDWGDVTYNPNTNLWACCGTNTACDTPTDETFLAPPPLELLAAASSLTAATQSSATATPGAMQGATVTVTATALATAHPASSLSLGAKAGIGVGAALAAIAIIGLIVWVVLLKKRTKSRGQARYSARRHDGNLIREDMVEGAPRNNVVNKHELNGYGRPHELGET